MLFRQKTQMVDPHEALPGRTDMTMPVPERHHALGTPLVGPWPAGHATAVFGMGCFWGAERKFWQTAGVYSTAVGYAGGYTPNATYEEACSGRTGHAEVVLVVFDPAGTTVLGAATHHMNIDHSAWEGFRVDGKVDTVVSRGTVVVRDDQYLGRAGHGRFVRRGLSSYLV